jgi:hypothetical protein
MSKLYSFVYNIDVINIFQIVFFNLHNLTYSYHFDVVAYIPILVDIDQELM